MGEYMNKNARVWRGAVAPTNKSFVWAVTEEVSGVDNDKTTDVKVWNGTVWESLVADITGVNELLDEINGGGTYPLSYQTRTDNTLETTNKEVVSAINELNDARVINDLIINDTHYNGRTEVDLGKVPILDSGDLIKSENLPSYVDDVIESPNLATLEALTPKYTGKIYVTIDNGICYRYTGTQLVSISNIGDNEPTEIANSTDLNSLTIPGIYVCPTTAIAATLFNAPATDMEFALTIKRTAQTDGVQQYITYFGNPYNEYSRNYYGSWSLWELRRDYSGVPKADYSSTTRLEQNAADTFKPIPMAWFQTTSKLSFIQGTNNSLEYNPESDIAMATGLKNRSGDADKVFIANGGTTQSLRPEHTILADHSESINLRTLSSDNIFPMTAYMYSEITTDPIHAFSFPFSIDRKFSDNTVIFDFGSTPKQSVTLTFLNNTHYELPIRVEDGVTYSLLSGLYPDQTDNVEDYTTAVSYRYISKYGPSMQFYVYPSEPLVFKWFQRGGRYFFKLITN